MTQADRDTALNDHNAERSAIGIPLLSYNLTIEASAQAVADTCVFQHSSSDFGENIFAGSGSFGTMAVAVSSWMSEKSDWSCSTNKCSGTCGHYTQIVWADSVRLGCGLKNCGGQLGVYVVCQYDPPGNYVGENPFDTALCSKTQPGARPSTSSTTYTTASVCSALSLLGLVL
jgi:uncharacterized protein YkwD